MNQFYTPRFLKIFALMLVLLTQINLILNAQTNFTITKPFIATIQVCINSSSYNPTYLNYAFSSNVTTSSGNTVSHSIEISNDLGLITPRIIGSASPNLNVIFVGNSVISGQNLPFGNGYRIRILTSSPTAYSAFSDPFSIVEAPNTPTLNQTGSIILCTGISQTLNVTNPNNAYTYQWQNNGTIIANATMINYSTNLGGNYSVKVTNTNGCSVSSNSIYISQSSPINTYMSAQSSTSYGNPLFLTSNQAFTMNLSINGGKSPYNFTLSDGIVDISETNINFSKSYSFVAPVSGSKTYTLTIVTDACGSQLNNAASVKVRINNSRYCPSARTGNLGIKNFSIQGTSVSNLNSGKAPDGWGEYLNPANTNANVIYNFSITPLVITTNQQYFNIWADLNQNGIFDIDERIFPTGNNAGQNITNTYTGVLKLPATAFNGQTRLRVLLSNYYPVACETNSQGETEDYLLNVFNGITPTVITTDSLPKTGICTGQILPVRFTVSGTALPANTSYKVEASYYANFSSVIVIGTGQSSPINCNSNNSNLYYSQAYYLRVVPTNTIPNIVNIPSPNQLSFKAIPSLYNLGALLGNRTDQATGYNNIKTYSIEPSLPVSITAKVSGTPPFSVELSDGRVFSTSSPTDNIVIESNKILTADTKFKIVRIADNLCSITKLDSVNIYVGTPTLKILKVQRGYNDTASITKLCGQFVVRFTGTHLDSSYCRPYVVQISNENGSFATPNDIGNNCFNSIQSESDGGQYISCNIPSNFLIASGTGYKLRVVKTSTNLTSPIFSTNFEVFNPTTSFNYNINKTVINEGESAALNVNFSGGTSPYTITLNTYNNGIQSFSTALNSNSLVANLSPLHSEKYTIGYNSACYGYSGPTNQTLYLSVKTLDQSNAQWYVKPYQLSGSYELLRGTYLLSGIDTLFKRPFNNSVPSGIINQYYDYNSPFLLKPATILKAGESYSLAQIYSLSYGTANLLTGVWADLNQDGDFEDAGEELAKNNFSQFWNISQTQSFTIPTNSNIGFSRLRVRVAMRNDNQFFTLTASNILDNKYADTYDIPIVMLSNAVTGIISTPNISGNALCNGNAFSIEYAKYGIPAGTNANVELSDANGNFAASPPIIGQGTNASINVTLPMNMTSGNYKIRVVSNGIISPPTSPFAVITNNLASMVDGDWHAGSTWSCGRVPTVVDDVTVSGGTNITVFSGDARVGSLITNGVLSFLNGTRLKFKVP